jgi:ABC-type sugar transport system ATPase subunit
MGENGAGKSTLIRILAGATRQDGGTISIDGEPVSIENPSKSRRLGLRFIHQELSIIPQLSVAENIFLGRPYPRRLGILADWRELNRRAFEALAALEISHIHPGRKMARLSLGDQMLVKIAAAFLEEDGEAARLYVMDEPTAALTSGESERLFAVIAGLAQRKRSVIYVSHRMDEVMRIAHRVSVLRDGETVITRPITDVTKTEIIEWMTGRQIAEAYPRRQAVATSASALRLAAACSPTVSDISFDLRAGEIVGVTGLSGAGQSEVLRLVVGADKWTNGTIALDGRALTPGDPSARWAAGIAYLPRERRREGLLPRASVADNTVLPHLRGLSRAGIFRNQRAEMEKAGEIAARVKLKATSGRQPVFQLSGGNQQKVVLARAILAGPRILLLDEPTRGVDVAAKYDIHTLIRELSANGVAILVASSDLSELIGMADRILVMREGRQVAIVPTEGLTQASLLALSFGEPYFP